MAFRMHYASYGLIGYTMKILGGCTHSPLPSPSADYDPDAILAAFAEHVWAERLDDPNPFTDKFDCDKAPPLTLPSARMSIPHAIGSNRSARLELHA